MDFSQTKYQGDSMKPHDVTSTDESQLSFADLSQLPLLPNADLPQKPETEKNAAALPRTKYEMNLAEFPLARKHRFS